MRLVHNHMQHIVKFNVVQVLYSNRCISSRKGIAMIIDNIASPGLETSHVMRIGLYFSARDEQ